MNNPPTQGQPQPLVPQTFRYIQSPQRNPDGTRNPNNHAEVVSVTYMMEPRQPTEMEIWYQNRDRETHERETRERETREKETRERETLTQRSQNRKPVDHIKSPSPVGEVLPRADANSYYRFLATNDNYVELGGDTDTEWAPEGPGSGLILAGNDQSPEESLDLVGGGSVGQEGTVYVPTENPHSNFHPHSLRRAYRGFARSTTLHIQYWWG